MKIVRVRLLRVCGLSVGAILWLAVVLAAGNNSPSSREPRFVSKRPWAVGFGMDGTVTNVVSLGAQIQFRINGRFILTQFPPESSKPVQIEAHPKGWFAAAVTPDSFVAVTSNGRGASVQNDRRRLFEILKTAAERGAVVKITLMQPKIDFGTNDLGFTLLDAKVWQITDVDLR